MTRVDKELQAPSVVAVDIGGTFTDVVVRDATGEFAVRKLLSSPDDYSRSMIEGVRSLVGDEGWSGVSRLSHATTVATNAVLESTGPVVGLVTTAGFADVLEIGRLQRPNLYDLLWERRPPLVPRHLRLEVKERVDASGGIVQRLDEKSVREAAAVLARHPVEAVAVCLINSYANPQHELDVKRILGEGLPGIPIVVSTDLLAEPREYERTSTAVVNAYLVPVMSAYLESLGKTLREVGCAVEAQVMQSNGGLTDAASAALQPVRVIESGPAAGVMAATELARRLRLQNVISFDMGGTTAKACLVQNFRPGLTEEFSVGTEISREGRTLKGGGFPVRMPSIEIVEVSSGGGSIAWLDAGGALKVGPQSAGAMPGPACYGLGGTRPTFTDACVVLGILQRESIGQGQVRLKPELAVDAIRVHLAEALGISVEEAAVGVYEVTISNLMRAIRAITVEKGKDPQDFDLIAFGGGGGMVGAPLAHALGIQKVIFPAQPGVFSASGLLIAPFRRDKVSGVYRPFNSESLALGAARGETAKSELVQSLKAAGFDESSVDVSREISLQYTGQVEGIFVSWPSEEGDLDQIYEQFEAHHKNLYGHIRDRSDLELASVRVTADLKADEASHLMPPSAQPQAMGGQASTRLVWDSTSGVAVSGEAYGGRSLIAPSDELPAVIEEPDATVYIPAGFRRSLDESGTLSVEWNEARSREAKTSDAGAVSAASMEVFNNLLGTINDEMTIAIAHAAQSEVAKDTLDFATAICDARGRVIAQGVTMVLHAGSIPGAIERLLAEYSNELEPGDVFIGNDPYRAAGSHLPDVYVIKPLFDGRSLLGFAGTVCHVSDMGGRVPGGNAADSTEVFQEGLRLPLVKLMEAGRLSRQVSEILRLNVRVPDKVWGDVSALVNACSVAESNIRQIVSSRGSQYLTDHMEASCNHARRLFIERIHELPLGEYRFEDIIDGDGAGSGLIHIRVTIQRRGDVLSVDFSGTDPQVRGATNSPFSFTKSSVYFAVKATLGPDIPNNSGYFDLVDVKAPLGTVVNPSEPGATGAKGVTAFRIVDTVLGALAHALPGRVPAAGDGGATIVVFAGGKAKDRFVCVDILMSAWGGRPNADGLDGVSSAASNGRNTPVEIIEAAYPLRVEAYEFIPDSAGPGRYRGGLATRRTYRYLGTGPGLLQVRSDRNPTKPWPLEGGSPGGNSRNRLDRASTGERIELAGKFTMTIEPGDVFVHETGSGAGYSPARARLPESVARDVVERKVSLRTARDNYGVALNEATLEVDLKATQELRVPNLVNSGELSSGS